MDEYRAAGYSRTAHTPRRRSYRGAREEKKGVSRLAVLAAAILFAVGVKYAFPHFAAAVGEKISETFNYRAALAAIGEGLAGERRFTEALGEAWAVAWSPAADGVGAESGRETISATEPESTPAPAPPVKDAAAEPDVTPRLPELAEAALAAFGEASREYADYMTPAGAGYAI
ncbi:MAG: hypothetical protein LBC28_01580 [Oscillospiraceae bacterium]|jgi:hypothetical protein|nr:hypothetical protein [Oscillospiraceae bacterium]